MSEILRLEHLEKSFGDHKVLRDINMTVNKGDVIGYVGTTGWSTGNHLHFETRVDGTAVNPFSYAYEYV